MPIYKLVTLKDPVTGEYLIPRTPLSLGYEVQPDGDLTPPIEMNAATLGGKPASDYMLKSEYTPVDLSEYLKNTDADTKYAALNHNHDTVYTKKPISIDVTFTSSGWTSQSDGSFKQTIAASGLLVTDDYKTTTIMPVGNDNPTTQESTDTAYALVDRWTCDADGQLTARCPKTKPTVDFSVHVVILR